MVEYPKSNNIHIFILFKLYMCIWFKMTWFVITLHFHSTFTYIYYFFLFTNFFSIILSIFLLDFIYFFFIYFTQFLFFLFASFFISRQSKSFIRTSRRLKDESIKYRDGSSETVSINVWQTLFKHNSNIDRDLNSDRWSRRRACRPLDHQHDPSYNSFETKLNRAFYWS